MSSQPPVGTTTDPDAQQGCAGKTVVRPLNFPRKAPVNASGVDGPRGPVVCLFCDCSWEFPTKKDDYLAHLYLKHHLIISDVATIAILPEYLAFWRKQFEAVQFNAKEYCTTMLLPYLPDGTPVPDTEYFLLDDNLPIDRAQRIHLHNRRLEAALAQHKFERTDNTYKRSCIFCRDVCEPNRAALIKHLFQKHFLTVGRAENLVYIDEYIDDIDRKLKSLICLYCGRTYTGRPALKEHMRKRGHKRIDPDDKFYDKFYIVNYNKDVPIAAAPSSGPDEAARDAQANAAKVAEASSSVFESPDDSDPDWSDWEDGSDHSDLPAAIRCLFCAHTSAGFAQLTEHIASEHDGVDLEAQLSALTFHQKIKLINYVRQQMQANACVTCEQQFADDAALLAHLREAKHYGTGMQQQWDQPNFLFPLFEDDALLFCLDDLPSSASGGSSSTSARSRCESPVDMADGVQIYAEEIRVEVNEDAEALSKELMKKL